MEQTELHKKIDNLPPDLKSEVNDFVDFLINKKKEGVRSDSKNTEAPIFGSGKHLIDYVADDFNAPLDLFKDYQK